MCLILLAYKAHPDYPLILAANRDEYYDRPTAPAAFWEDVPTIYAGRDLVHGGTWLGVTRNGRIAALTNYRDPLAEKRDSHSRGKLVSGFLDSAQSPQGYLDELRTRQDSFNGFNLLAGDLDALFCFSNKTGETVRIGPGIHGVSNHLFNTPWPKVVRGKEGLARMVARGSEIAPDSLLDLLADRRPAPDHELPATGIPLELERLLSSIFIASPAYGTRASTVLLINRHRRATYLELTHFRNGKGGIKRVELDFSKEDSPGRAD